MPVLLNEPEPDLMRKILVAGSQEEVKILIDDSLKLLQQTKMAPADIAAFVDNNINFLETLNPMNKDAGEWSNINMARIHLQHIKRIPEIIPANH